MNKLKFNDFDEMVEYYDNNAKLIYLYTLEQLKKFWKENKCKKTVDIYRVNIPGFNSLKFMSILENNWDNIFKEMEEYFVRHEMYEEACLVRDFNKEVNS